MFKESFKYYKTKCCTIDFSNVLDLNNDITWNKYNVKKNSIDDYQQDSITSISFCFKPVKTWEVFQINDKPGLIVIKNPFTSIGQRYWVVKCLRDYSKKPNRRNIDSITSISNVDNWWEKCNKLDNNELLKKLRWSTLGYHHNWDTKLYSEKDKTNFPHELKELTQFLADILGYPNYSAEAAIINYYHMDSTLSGHTDHSEVNLKAPLFSFSFGQTAIFLIGGKTIEDSAIPIFLRSGDILIMSNESRLCYHGVPRILKTEERPWEIDTEDSTQEVLKYNDALSICKDEEIWKPFSMYINYSRVNMNIRQVLNKGQQTL
ncbi:alpha-ketoglutarate-dependent dioxygenase AlkB [Rhynchophorus ferrugineus]|uniref:alpha-ketoglutarate-dependent dioxygenase AlkB n=1 Tax=Rhynchophorus ferrugineus TaxID=354439 RepID=UPI003FCDAA8C